MKIDKKRILKTVSFALSVILLSCAMVLLVANADETDTWGGESVEAAYGYSTLFEVPERSVGGNTDAVSHTLIFPDGTSTYADSVRLSMFGDYSLIYTAKVGDKVYSEAHSFTVPYQLYSTTDRSSSFEYKTVENTREEIQGLVVNLAGKDTLSFNKLIKVSDLSLEQAFVNGFILPASAGSSSFSTLNITLTDAENPDIYFTISIKERDVDSTKGKAYVLAGGNGQDMVAAEVPANSKNWVTGGSVYTNGGGAEVYAAFDGYASVVCPDYDGDGKSDYSAYTFNCYNGDYPFAFYFDPSSLELWHETNYFNPDTNGNGKVEGIDWAGESNKDLVTGGGGGYRRWITDFDKPEWYRTLWSGFESEYVRLSISADNYSASFATFCITDVCGMDISSNDFSITDAPVISIDNADNLPEAKVGGWYPIPEAYATDLYFGKIEVNTNVYFNYSEDNSYSVRIEDGKFKTDRPGYYAIVYTATSDVGIVSEKVIYIHASEDIMPVVIDIDADTQVSEAKILDFVDYADVALTEGTGDITLRVYAKFGDRIIDTEGGFRPDAIGTWQVIYEATDYIGQVSESSYYVEVISNDDYVLVDKIQLPRVFISGGKYLLPEIYARGAQTGSIVDTLCDVSITVNGKTESYKAGEIADIFAENRGDIVTVKYLCGGQELYSEDIPTVNAYDADGVLDYTQYFVTTGASAAATENGCVISASGETASFYYANPVVAEKLEIVLRFMAEKANFNEVVITLTDYADENNSIRARLVHVNGIVTMIVEGKQYATGYQYGLSNFNLALNYKGGKFILGTTEFPVTKTTDGALFDGFKSDKVYVDVEINGIESASELNVISMRGYKFLTQTEDMIEPYFVSYELTKQSGVGEQITLPAFLYGDMISPGTIATLSVRGPDGKFVTSVSGVELKNCDPGVAYTFEVTATGKYTVSYKIVKDNNFIVGGYDRSYGYSISVIDDVSPEIVITTDYTREANVGDIIVRPDYTYSDNESSAENMKTYVYIVTPNGQIVVTKGNSIQVGKSGVYTWHIVVMDETGNMEIKKLEVVVK